jgi:hypothetical protein
VRFTVFDLADITLMEMLGIFGALLYLLSYTAVQTSRIDGNGLGYTIINTIAAGLVLLGLTQNFNLAAALIQIAWLLIGTSRLIFGLGREDSVLFGRDPVDGSSTQMTRPSDSAR